MKGKSHPRKKSAKGMKSKCHMMDARHEKKEKKMINKLKKMHSKKK